MRKKNSKTGRLWEKFSTVAIIGLCVYISGYCIENIFDIDFGKKMLGAGKKTVQTTVKLVAHQKNRYSKLYGARNASFNKRTNRTGNT